MLMGPQRRPARQAAPLPRGTGDNPAHFAPLVWYYTGAYCLLCCAFSLKYASPKCQNGLVSQITGVEFLTIYT